MNDASLAAGLLRGFIVFYCIFISSSAWAAECPTGSYTQRTVTGGIGCVIQPSRTDPAIQDAGSSSKGYGYHVVGIPGDPTQIQGVYVHFMGSGARPYDQATGGYSVGQILEDALARNFMFIALAYVNPETIGQLCGGDSACYGLARQEVIYGDAVSPEVSVNTANSILNRMDALVDFLEENFEPASALPAAFAGAAVDWSQVRVGGGSQGGGHAGYIGRDFLTERVCFMASPEDTVTEKDAFDDPGVIVSAAWLTEGAWKTPTASLKGIVHEDEDGYEKITTNFAALGMVPSTSETQPNNDWVKITIPVENPHTAPTTDEALSYARDWACFSDGDGAPPPQPLPVVTSFSPTSGKVGTRVTLRGSSLEGTTAVKFGGVSSTPTSVSSRSVRVGVPTGAASGPITVVTPGGNASSTKHFQVLP
ncbi:MAG: IPT/TIG domain-containing protein [Aphanocapsa lilacina HA4352-LM1]|jgi:hypothetical protein|nr:IPT/TIG domain-containing protein [Aphanocapsa lilacina HA4352-LM1]